MAVMAKITLKPVIAGCLNISTEKAAKDVKAITENMMESILDYTAHCELEEAKIEQRREQELLVLENIKKKMEMRKKGGTVKKIKRPTPIQTNI